MFEDVFEPFDDILDDKELKEDDWNSDLWDTGEKEDMWRSDIDAWCVDSEPVIKPLPSKTTTAIIDDDEDCGEEDGEEDKKSSGTGFFDDIFLDIH